MNDLYYPSNRDEFYHTSHHIKELLKDLQKAGCEAEIDNIHMLLIKSVDHICRVKYTDIDEHNEHMAFILDTMTKAVYYGKKT